MKLIVKSLAIGIGGTLAYYALIYAVMQGMDGADWTVPMGRYQVFQFIGEALIVPLIPGALPGLLIAAVLAALGLVGGSFHDAAWFIGGGLSAPLVHSYFVHSWLNRRERRRK